MIFKSFIRFSLTNALKPSRSLSDLDFMKPALINLNWNSLIQPLRQDEKIVIEGIVFPNNKYSEKSNSRLTMLDPSVCSFSQYVIILMIIGVNRSKDMGHFKQKIMITFFQNLQEKEELIKSGKFSEEAWQHLLLEISFVLYEVYIKMDRKKKMMCKTQFLNFLNKNEKYIKNLFIIDKLLKIICKIVEEGSFILDVIKFSPFVQKMILKIKNELTHRNCLQPLNQKADQNIQKRLPPRLFINTFKILNTFFIMTPGILKFFLETVLSPSFRQNFVGERELIKFYLHIYRFCYDYLDSNKQNPVLATMKEKCKSSPKFKIEMFSQDITSSIRTFQLMLNGKINAAFRSSQTFLVDNMVIIKQIKKPVLDEFEIEYFKRYEKSIAHSKSKAYSIMRSCYPELVRLKTSEEPVHYVEQVQQQSIDNEIVSRIGMALESLGINFQREVQTRTKRKVDFLLTDSNIVIECDGDYHVNYEELDVNSRTCIRNMLLLMEGYRCISIHISEFNQNRLIENLAKLIEKKLKKIEQYKAIYIF